MYGKNETGRKGTPTSQVKRLEERAKITLGKTDADRRKSTKKAVVGAVRICPQCHAVSERKRWRTDPGLADRFRHQTVRPIEEVLCPGCDRLASGRVDGWVELRGPVIAQQLEAIQGRIAHVVAEARRTDPVHRIAKTIALEDRLVLEVTSEQLALSIGRAIARSWGGNLQIHYNEGEEFARVYWVQGSASSGRAR